MAKDRRSWRHRGRPNAGRRSAPVRNRKMTLPRLFSLLESSAVRLATLVLIAGLPISAVTFLAHTL